MPLSAAQKMKNIKKVRKQLLDQRDDSIMPDVLDSRLSSIGEGRRRDIAPAAGEMTSTMRQRDALHELSRCRAEFTQLRKLIESRSNMLSSALDVIEQNGLTIPTGAKKFKKSIKNKSMRKPIGKSKPKGKSRRNMSRRRRR